MADLRVHSKGRSGGFTLIEILIAMMILVFSVSTLLAGFMQGIATEQESELLRDASRLAAAVQEKLVSEDILGKDTANLPEPVRGAILPEFPGLSYDLDFEGGLFTGAPVYVTLRVIWLRRGEAMYETFRFPLPKGRPLPVRIREEQEAGR